MEEVGRWHEPVLAFYGRVPSADLSDHHNLYLAGLQSADSATVAGCQDHKHLLSSLTGRGEAVVQREAREGNRGALPVDRRCHP